MSETPTAPPLPDVHPVIGGLSDFSEKLSPVLVKELRQGLRTNSFTVLFLIVQGILAFVTLSVCLSVRPESAGSSVSTTIFFLYGVAALIVQPLRGSSALFTEIKAQTIDLLVLTRLSAWRITYGKWMSIFAQTLLLLTTLIPYLILRYFFGGMELVAELTFLFLLTVLSGGATAVTVGLSGNKSAFVRTLLPILGAIFLLFSGFGFAVSSVIGGRGGGSFLFSGTTWTWEVWAGLAGFVCAIGYLGYYFLELGAGMIAPAAENRSTRKRLIALLFFLVVLVPLAFFAEEEFTVSASLFFLFLVGLDVLTEPGFFPSSVCAPFVKRGALGKLAGRFLYPGWFTGVFFFGAMSLAVSLLIGSSVFRSGFYGPNEENILALIIVIGQGLFPAVVTRLILTRSPNPFALYLAIYLLSGLLAILVTSFNRGLDGVLMWAFSFIPAVGMAGMDRSTEPMIALQTAIALAYLCILFVLARPYLAAIGLLEKEAAENELRKMEPADEPS